MPPNLRTLVGQTLEFDLGFSSHEPESVESGAVAIPDLLALSIRQPWATSIIHGKPVENRNWRGLYLQEQLQAVRDSGGRFLIHAAMGMDDEDIEGWRDLIEERQIEVPWAEGLKLGALPRGGIIGVARFVCWTTSHASPWFNGSGAIVMADVKPLPFAPCRGALGFFRPSGVPSQRTLSLRERSRP